VITLAEVRALPVRHVAGLMSGTSMDGLDVALCRIRPGPQLRFELLAFETVPLPEGLRARLAPERLDNMGEIARLDLDLGRFLADALREVVDRHPLDLHLIGSHGQTVYHEHRRTTLQLGEPSPLALRFACPVIHDFRRADIAAGGSGAPLVPYVDHRLLGGRGEGILAVNLGGIANFTALERDGGGFDRLIAMDCGPANMVLDGLIARWSGGRLQVDLDGRMAARGRLREDLFAWLAAHPFFALPPPKSTGREQFGAPLVEQLLARADPQSEQDWCDLLATASELTAWGVHDHYRRFAAPTVAIDAVAVSGGGARNPDIMRRLGARFAPLPVRPSDAWGLPVDAKEAIAFAVLASDRVDRRAANVPSVTGAERPVLLGKITEG
jgi:anhydro-N-acetylmuramic acid kinase